MIIPCKWAQTQTNWFSAMMAVLQWTWHTLQSLEMAFKNSDSVSRFLNRWDKLPEDCLIWVGTSEGSLIKAAGVFVSVFPPWSQTSSFHISQPFNWSQVKSVCVECVWSVCWWQQLWWILTGFKVVCLRLLWGIAMPSRSLKKLCWEQLFSFWISLCRLSLETLLVLGGNCTFFCVLKFCRQGRR